MSSESAAAQYFLAVDKNDIQEVERLLASKLVSVHSQNLAVKRRTGLHLAAHYGHCELVRALVDRHGADVNVEDSAGLIPLQLATDRYHMKVVKFLLSRNSDRREYAADFLNSDEVEEWFRAVAANDIPRAIELLDGGVDVNCEDLSDHHRTALSVAAARGHRELTQLLLVRGADPEYVDDCDESPYDIAANNGHDDIANILLESGHRDDYDGDSVHSSSSDTDISLSYLPN